MRASSKLAEATTSATPPSQGAAQQSRPNGAALYARPSGMRAGVNLHSARDQRRGVPLHSNNTPQPVSQYDFSRLNKIVSQGDIPPPIGINVTWTQSKCGLKATTSRSRAAPPDCRVEAEARPNAPRAPGLTQSSGGVGSEDKPLQSGLAGMLVGYRVVGFNAA